MIDAALADVRRARRTAPASRRASRASTVVALDLVFGAIVLPGALGLLGLRSVFTLFAPMTEQQHAQGAALFTAAAVVAVTSAVVALVILVGGFLESRRGATAAAVVAVVFGLLGGLAQGMVAWGLDPHPDRTEPTVDAPSCGPDARSGVDGRCGAAPSRVMTEGSASADASAARVVSPRL